MTTASATTETATLGGGCFWCLEAVYQELPGVDRVVSGYAGGHVENPTYRQVCSGTTGHAEVVQVHFDPREVSYERILEAFFAIHDPTTRDRQGADTGPQYRSIILYHSPAQRATAEELVASLEEQELYRDPIVTEVVPLEVFYPAEEAHQNYYRENSRQPYCQAVISPKLAKFRAQVLGQG